MAHETAQSDGGSARSGDRRLARRPRPGRPPRVPAWAFEHELIGDGPGSSPSPDRADLACRLLASMLARRLADIDPRAPHATGGNGGAGAAAGGPDASLPGPSADDAAPSPAATDARPAAGLARHGADASGGVA